MVGKAIDGFAPVGPYLVTADLIFTGTPAGVIHGQPKDQQAWLKRGDALACSVQGLGELAFRLV